MLIITFTSIPTRFHLLEPMLNCLLAQTAMVDRIILYIPRSYRRFPDWDGVLPSLPQGIEVRRVETDLGPSTKVLFAAREFRGQDCDILLCDDDRRYKPDWAQTFVEERKKRPDACIAIAGFEADRYGQSKMLRDLHPRATPRSRNTDFKFNARMIKEFLFPPVPRKHLREPVRRLFKKPGFVDIFEGLSGALVRPEFFDDDAFEIQDVIWAVDDVWLSGHLARRGVPIWVMADRFDTQHTPAGLTDALHKASIEGADREVANMRCIEYFKKTYGLWP